MANTRKVVAVPLGAFEKTDNGMGLQRKRGRAGATLLPGGAGGGASSSQQPVVSIDFKRQREADAARARKGQTLCAHFCRHGRCESTRECPYEHDPLKVAICQDFLHGTCHPDLSECALSHAPSPETMPTCNLYMRGLCVDPACPFPHVHLGEKVPLCEAFRRLGYCEKGAQCDQRHELVCAAFAARGECALGERCRLRCTRRRPPAPSQSAASAPATPPASAVPRPILRQDSALPNLPSRDGEPPSRRDGGDDVRWRL